MPDNKSRMFTIQLDELSADRADALRIVMGASRAEVIRQGLERGGLNGLERGHVLALSRLYLLAEACALPSWREYVQLYVKTYRQAGPALEALLAEARQTGRDPITRTSLTADVVRPLSPPIGQALSDAMNAPGAA